ncbi:MAG: hypothetical protein U1F48_02405 [Burkholderiales bacterium]
MTLARLAVPTLLAFAASVALAQSGSRLADPAPAPPSRWQAERDAMDGALRAAGLAANEPRSQWLAGRLGGDDPVAQVANFARARQAAPGDKLYLSSLAVACLAPVQPLPDECQAIDRLADWATRDADNGVPSLLMAERARRRNNVASEVAFLEEAAQRPRFDDYSSAAAVAIWEAVRTLPGGDPAAKAELAASYGLLREPYAVSQLAGLCRDPARTADNVRAACYAAGNAVAQRGATWALRIAGARLAERSAMPADHAKAQAQLADVQRRALDCAEAGNGVAAALESADAGVRAKAVAQWEARLAQDARVGEAAACVAPGKG